MTEIDNEKIRQLISRTDMTGNEKVEWLINFLENDYLKKNEQQLKQKIEADFKKWQEDNNFVHIVEDRKGYEQGYFSTREKAERRIKEIQSAHREALVINCQKIY